MLSFYYKFSVGWKFTWPTIVLMMKIIVGSRKLLWSTIVGLFVVVVWGVFLCHTMVYELLKNVHK